MGMFSLHNLIHFLAYSSLYCPALKAQATAAAVIGGYVLGRTKKGGAALALAS